MKLRSLLVPALALGVVALTVPLVAGYWGELHPAFDALAHFRAHLAVLVVLGALPLLFLKGWRRIGLMAIALGVAALASISVASGGAPQVRAGANEEADGTPLYRLLQLNLRYDNETPKKVLSLIGRVEPDIVTLEEVSGMWREQLALLEARYPYRIVCPPPSPIGGVAILSRRPFLHPSLAQCHNRGALATATVRLGERTLDVAALHLGWPWPFGQQWQAAAIAPVLSRMSGPAILAGDLNAAPWSVTARRVAAAGDFALVGALGPSWLALPAPDMLRRTVGLPIDNIFIKGHVRPVSTRRLESVGSDHLPVLMEFTVETEPPRREMLHAMTRPAYMF